jgi:hypothetical protein
MSPSTNNYIAHRETKLKCYLLFAFHEMLLNGQRQYVYHVLETNLILHETTLKGSVTTYFLYLVTCVQEKFDISIGTKTIQKTGNIEYTMNNPENW